MTRGDAGGGRDVFIDFVRAFSLIVVVLWHWVFTILVWTPEGPIASNPIGYTEGLWVATWFFQVMPLFFFVGGFAHKVVWGKVSAAGGGYWAFVGGRVRKLVVPALALVGTWIVLGIAAVALGATDRTIATNSVILILSPLWFLCVYVALVFLAPPMLRLHQWYGPIVIVTLAACAGMNDVLRFRHGYDATGLFNLFFVWALCHQLGFFYDDLLKADRRWYWTMALTGFLTLQLFVFADFYPGSMVGVPGEAVSNMAPPTLCMIALVFFQAGLALLIRPWLLRRLERRRWKQANELINRFSLPLYLFHSTGYALALALLKVAGAYETPTEPTGVWWAQRPIFLLLPLLCTLPVIVIFSRTTAGRFGGTGQPVAVGPPEPAVEETST